MTEEGRDLLARAYRDLEAALAAARRLWGEDAGEETLIRAAEMFLIHLRELRRNGGTPVPPHGERVTAEPLAHPPGTEGAAPRACPVCSGPMRDQRATKRGNQPDFKRQNRQCDGAIWLDRAAR